MTPKADLLLLPPPPVPLSPAAVEAAYPAIASVLTNLSSKNASSGTTRLDVAISSPFTARHSLRGLIFPPAQELLAALYRLICLTAAKHGVDLDLPGGLDVRVLLLEQSPTSTLANKSKTVKPLMQLGPIFDLETFSESFYVYRTIHSVESEAGETLLQQLITLVTSHSGQISSIERIRGGMIFSDNTADGSSIKTPYTDTRKHCSVAVGGTFDHLHIGHKLLLTATTLALESPSNAETPLSLIIGITGDELLVNKKHATEVETWDVRQQKTADFVESILVVSDHARQERKVESINEPGPNGKRVISEFGISLRINYVQISDPFGPTITDQSISALVVSGETRAGGKAVNDRRAEKGWSLLEVFEVAVLDASGENQNLSTETEDNFQSKISSTAIRERLVSAAT